jgi:hypothetical protein
MARPCFEPQESVKVYAAAAGGADGIGRAPDYKGRGGVSRNLTGRPPLVRVMSMGVAPSVRSSISVPVFRRRAFSVACAAGGAAEDEVGCGAYLVEEVVFVYDESVKVQGVAVAAAQGRAAGTGQGEVDVVVGLVKVCRCCCSCQGDATADGC